MFYFFYDWDRKLYIVLFSDKNSDRLKQNILLINASSLLSSAIFCVRCMIKICVKGIIKFTMYILMYTESL